jgi:hypothetical protein
MDNRESPSDQMIAMVTDVMRGESDRGCVLAGAALIEWQMAELLRAVFLERHPETTPEIEEQIRHMIEPTNEKSILGAAAARGRMCRALNLVSEDIHKLLKKFLKFRNQHFAHAHRLVRLTNPSIKRDLDKLWLLVPEDFQGIFQAQADDRDRLIRTVVVLYFCFDYGSQPSSS